MEARLKLLDGAIIKQAIRDVASKNPELSNKAILYFHSKDFVELCQRHHIDSNQVSKSIKELSKYPLISKKKIANEIARLVDGHFGEWS